MIGSIERTLRTIHRAAGLRGFAIHAAVLGVVAVTASSTGGDREFFWPLVGWTVGLFMHGLSALGPGRFLTAAWELEALRKTSEATGK